VDIICIAAVGLGESFQKIHLPIIQNLPMFALVKVHDVDLEYAEQVALQLNCERADTLQSILSDPTIQGVVVCTPPSSQLQISLKALEASKYVLCEKPLGFGPITIETENHKLFPFLPYLDSPIGSHILQTSANHPVKGLNIIFGHAGIGTSWKPRTNWYFDKTVSGGGVLLDLGSHLLPLLPLLNIDLFNFEKQVSSNKDATPSVEVDAVLTKPGFSLKFSWVLERSSEVMAIEYDSAPSLLVDFRAGILTHSQVQICVPTAAYGVRSYVLWAQTISGVPKAIDWTRSKLEAVQKVRQWLLDTQGDL
jgi:hypothetical protein